MLIKRRPLNSGFLYEENGRMIGKNVLDLVALLDNNIFSMEMKEPFDIELGDMVYSVFPEEEDAYVIFKDGTEYVKIIKDTDTTWLKLNPETELPMFGMDEEINLIGEAIKKELGQ